MSERKKITSSIQPAVVTSLGETLVRREDLPAVDQIRVATYNTYNLFEDAPDQQKQALGHVIRELDADAIAFQEVESERVLKEVFQRFVNPRLRNAGERSFDAFVCIPARDPRGINVALATRLAVRATTSFHDYEFGEDERPERFSRDLLGVELFATHSYRFLFFVAHLKSKLGGERADKRRRLQASEIRRIFGEPLFGSESYIDHDLILAGDMNDDPDRQTIEVLKRGDEGEDQLLEDLLEEVEPNYTYPTHTRYKKTRLDYFFASPGMAARVSDEERRIYREHPTHEASDHYPASIVIDVSTD